MGYVKPLLGANPNYILLDLNKEDCRERRILVRRLDGKPLRILEVGVSIQGIAVLPGPSTASDEASFLVRVDGLAETKHAWGEVTLVTDHPLQPRLVLPLAVLPKKGLP
jgi:hypothetical protein